MSGTAFSSPRTTRTIGATRERVTRQPAESARLSRFRIDTCLSGTCRHVHEGHALFPTLCACERVEHGHDPVMEHYGDRGRIRADRRLRGTARRTAHYPGRRHLVCSFRPRRDRRRVRLRLALRRADTVSGPWSDASGRVTGRAGAPGRALCRSAHLPFWGQRAPAFRHGGEWPGSFHYGEERPRRRGAAPGDHAKWRSAAAMLS